MSFYCDANPNLSEHVCADDIFVKVKNFPPSTPCQTPLPIPPAKLIKVPVKVAIIDVTEPLTDNIFISGGFEEVKKIQRHLTLTQCHVTNQFLFVEGYILKNVGYAVPCGNDKANCDVHCKVIKNDYRDLTAKLKFHFTVPITLTNAINVLNEPVTEGTFFVDCTKPCDEGTLGELHCEKFYQQTVVLNEGFKCELEAYSINESVFLKKENCETDWRYDTIVEKLELTLTLAILQNQQIVVNC